MPTNVGSQTIVVKYFDPVDSSVANSIAIGVRKLGIYSGGYLTRVNDTTVTLSTFDCEIGDGTYQIRGKTASTVNITVASATPYVVLRWTYTGSSSADYIDFQAVASGGLLSTDVIVGKCNFTGATLTGFDYTSRTNPNVLDYFLKVEPTAPASLYVRVRAGRVNYGSQNYDIIDQLSPLLIAPGSNSWIVAIQVNNVGAVVATYGDAAASPVAPSYGGLVTLAEITIASGQTSITSTSIKDVRNVASSGLSINSLTEKTSVTGNDVFVIEDSASSYAKKKVKAINVGPQDIILWGFEATYVSTTSISVLPGILYNGATPIKKTAATTLNLGTASDWYDGATHSYSGGAGFCYIGVDPSGNIKLLATNAPNRSDTLGNSAGTLLYSYIGSTYWRVLRVNPWIHTDDTLTKKWFQQDKLVMYDVPLVITTIVSANAWSSAVSCSTAIPPTSTLGVFGLYAYCSTSGYLNMRPNGSTSVTNYQNGVSMTNNYASGQRLCMTDSSQQIQHNFTNGNYSGTMSIDVEGYYSNL